MNGSGVCTLQFGKFQSSYRKGCLSCPLPCSLLTEMQVRCWGHHPVSGTAVRWGSQCPVPLMWGKELTSGLFKSLLFWSLSQQLNLCSNSIRCSLRKLQAKGTVYIFRSVYLVNRGLVTERSEWWLPWRQKAENGGRVRERIQLAFFPYMQPEGIPSLLSVILRPSQSRTASSVCLRCL